MRVGNYLKLPTSVRVRLGDGIKGIMMVNDPLPWEPKTFIFRGYNPYIGGFKPSFFMVLGSRYSTRWFKPCPFIPDRCRSLNLSKRSRELTIPKKVTAWITRLIRPYFLGGVEGLALGCHLSINSHTVIYSKISEWCFKTSIKWPSLQDKIYLSPLEWWLNFTRDCCISKSTIFPIFP